jgi:hypothetical protein
MKGSLESRRPKSLRGSAMAQLMMAVALSAGVMLLLSRVSLNAVKVGKRASDHSALHQMQADAVALNKDISTLLKTWRDPSMLSVTGEIADCIPETEIPKCLPAEQIMDSTVKQKAAGLVVRSVRLANTSKNGAQLGTPIAGTERSPVFYNGEGAPCPAGASGPQCRFQGTGYMIRQNASGDPGNVRFIVKFERNPRNRLSDESPLAPVYAVIEVGMRWRGPSSAPTCDGVLGFDIVGDPLCYPYPNCQPGYHFSGWDAAGVPQCVSDKQVDCPVGQGVAGYDAQGIRVCKPIVNAGQWSGCTVACGGGVATSCSYPFPNPAIPNDGACSRVAPQCNTGPCSCSHTGPDCWTAWSACGGGTCEKVGQNTRRCQATPPMTCVDPANQGTLSTRTNRRTGVTTLQESKPCDFSSTNRWTGQNRSFPIIWAASPCGFDRWYDVSGCSYSVGGVPTWPWPGSPPGSPSFSADQCRYGSFPRGSLYIFGPGRFITGGAVPNSP